MLHVDSRRITRESASLMASHPRSEDRKSDVSAENADLGKCRNESGGPVKDLHLLEGLRHDTVFGSCRLRRWVTGTAAIPDRDITHPVSRCRSLSSPRKARFARHVAQPQRTPSPCPLPYGRGDRLFRLLRYIMHCWPLLRESCLQCTTNLECAYSFRNWRFLESPSFGAAFTSRGVVMILTFCTSFFTSAFP